MNDSAYLVNYGPAGELGVFHTDTPFDCRRGDRVVIRRTSGLEVGVVVCPATERHERLLDGAELGSLVRRATPADEDIVAGAAQRAQQIFEAGRRLADELHLPLEILDVAVPLDGHQVTLYFVRWGECDERPLVAALSKKYEALVALRDLALPAGASACGKADCGKGAGGCTTCGTGGCATGCGSKAKVREVSEYFQGLRQKMEGRFRAPLL
jgi:cell fate regulator YaaT (PSP1 superfamily)